MLLSIFPLSVFADDVENNNITYEDLSSSTIVSDFERVFPLDIKLEDYKENTVIDEFVYIATMETFKDNLSQIYIYLWNPSRMVVYKESEKNTLSVASYSDKFNVFDKNNYIKEHLTLVDEYDNTLNSDIYSNALILKYKVDNVSLEDSAFTRNYKISDVELLLKDEILPSHYMIGKHLQFFVDENGFTNIAEKDLANLELQTYHTFYRTKTSNVDVYEDIQSVFFAIPNELIDVYGNKMAMKLNYSIDDYNPILVVNNQKIADDFNSSDFINGSGSSDIDSFKYSVLFDKMTWLPGDLIIDGWRKGYNVSSLHKYKNSLASYILLGQEYYLYSFDNIVELPLWPDVKAPKESYISPLRLAIYSDYDLTPESTAIFGEDLIHKINSKSNDSLFKASTKDVVDTLTVVSKPVDVTKFELSSAWDNFINFGKGYQNEAGEITSFDVFQQIDLKDLKNLSRDSFSAKYLIDKYDVDCNGSCDTCFKCVSSKSEYKNHTWFILHYTKTNYEGYDSVVIDNSTGYYEACDSFVFKTEVIRGFDVITVGLTDNAFKPLNLWTIFPVGHSPSDFVADVTTPSHKPTIELDDLGNEFKDLIDRITKILKIVFVLILVVFAFKGYEFIKSLLKKAERKEWKNETENI